MERLNVVGTALVVFAAIMIIQQYIIAWNSQDENENWSRVARRYVWHRYYTAIFSLIATMVAISVSLALIFNRHGGEWLADEYIGLLVRESLISLFGIGLLAAVFRTIIDRRIERLDAESRENDTYNYSSTKKRRTSSKIKVLFFENLLLSWFLVSYIFFALLALALQPVLTFVHTSEEIQTSNISATINAVDDAINKIDTQITDGLGEDPTTPSALQIAKTATEVKLREVKETLKTLGSTNQPERIVPLIASELEKANRSIENLNELNENFLDEKIAKTNEARTTAESDLDTAEDENKKAEAAAKETPTDETNTASVASKSKWDSAKNILTGFEELLKDLEQKKASPIEIALTEEQKVQAFYRQKLPAAAIAIVVWGILWFSWYRWVYSHIHTRLREQHRFRGPAVNNFMKQRDDLTPTQIVVIGPKNSGKSELVEQWSDVPKEPNSTRPVFRTRKHRNFLHSLCDMPGENLGDHVAYMSRYRIDWLVIVFRAAAFLNDKGDLFCDEADVKSKISKLDSVPDVCSSEIWKVDPKSKHPLPPGDGVWASQYFTALRLVLKEAGLQTNDSYLLSHVRNLMLVLNYDESDEKEKKVALEILNEKHIKNLLSSIVWIANDVPIGHACRIVSVKTKSGDLLNILTPEVKEDEKKGDGKPKKETGKPDKKPKGGTGNPGEKPSGGKQNGGKQNKEKGKFDKKRNGE